MGLRSRLSYEFGFIRGNLSILLTSWVLVNLVGSIPYIYFSLYVEELGGTPAIIGLINLVSFAALASVQFLGGYLADVYGRKKLIVFMTFGFALSNIIFAIAPSWQYILIAVAIQNFCLIYQPAISAITADSIPQEKRGIGFSSIMFLSNLASLASPPIAGILFLYYGKSEGVRVAFLLVAAFFIAAAIIRTRLKETLLNNTTEKKKLKDILLVYPQAVKEGFSVWKLLPRTMLALLIINVIGSFSFALMDSYLVLYAIRILGLQELQWAFLMTWFTAVMILGALPSGKLVDKCGRAKCLLASWIIYAPFPLLFLYGSLPLLYLGFFLFGASNALFMPGYSAIEADLVPKELRGKEAGSSSCITYAFMAIGGLAGGLLYESVSPTMPFLVAFGLALFSTLLQMVFVRGPKKRSTK